MLNLTRHLLQLLPESQIFVQQSSEGAVGVCICKNSYPDESVILSCANICALNVLQFYMDSLQLYQLAIPFSPAYGIIHTYTLSSQMQQNTDIWTELALHHLTPRSIGLLECVSKTLQRVVKDPRVWERQAVLAWNGFYTLFHHSHRADVERFLAERVNYKEVEDCVTGVTKLQTWSSWAAIMGEMEIIGDGYQTEGVATDDPKEIAKYELADDWGMDFLGERQWVVDLKYDNAATFSTDSDGSSDLESDDRLSNSGLDW